MASHDNGQGESRQKSELQWQEVELNDALTKVTATMHGIVSEGSERNAQLGPIPTAKVKLEGSETEALLDTGSPVTIVSLQFLLEALAKQKRSDQSPDDWRQMVEKRFEPSTINLQNYSGVKINIIRQMTVSISRSGNAEVQATVQVQKYAPAKLLIGTDLLPALGFIFLQTELEGEDVDLLKPQQARAEVNKESPEPSKQTSGSDREVLGVKGLSMAEAAKEPDADNCVTLIMQNDVLEPTRLKKGQILGRIVPASLLTNTEQTSCDDEEQGLFMPSLNLLSSAPQDPERESQCERGTSREDQLLATVGLD